MNHEWKDISILKGAILDYNDRRCIKCGIVKRAYIRYINSCLYYLPCGFFKNELSCEEVILRSVLE